MVKRLSNTDQNNTALQNVPTPAVGGDAANKTYVDDQRDTRQPSSSALTALAALATNGSIHRTGLNTYASRTLTGTTNLITVTNGNGVSGNPTITVGSSVLRTDTAQTVSGVKTFSAIPIISSLTGYVYANGSGALTAATSIPQSAITNLVTDLGNKASTADLSTHTGATAAHGATGAVVGTTNTQTITNKSMSGTDNTFTDVPQSAVTNLSTDLSARIVRVVHGSNASTARPAGATYVEWVGSVAPTNANTTVDTWLDTTQA